MISTPRLLARWCVDGETSLMVINFLKHRGDWSSRRLAFLSSSQITTDISAGIVKIKKFSICIVVLLELYTVEYFPRNSRERNIRSSLRKRSNYCVFVRVYMTDSLMKDKDFKDRKVSIK